MIGPHVLLTAAHFVKTFDPAAEIFAVYGSTLSPNSPKRKVQKTFLYGYNKNCGLADALSMGCQPNTIAMLYLDKNESPPPCNQATNLVSFLFAIIAAGYDDVIAKKCRATDSFLTDVRTYMALINREAQKNGYEINAKLTPLN